MVSALLLSAANGWVVLSSAAHSDGFLSDGSLKMWVLRYTPRGRFAVTVMQSELLYMLPSLYDCNTAVLSSITFHNASILMFPNQHMFCHYGSQPNSLAERIMSSKKLEKRESADRVSVEAGLHSELPTSGCNMDPPAAVHTDTHMHVHTLATNPLALAHCRKMKKTQLCLLPAENQSDQVLGLPISCKHSLNITACALPAFSCHWRLFCQK